MLSDKEIEAATAQLGEVRSSHESHEATLSDVLEKYGNLMLDYKRLRSDLEEERDARERYKQMARG